MENLFYRRYASESTPEELEQGIVRVAFVSETLVPRNEKKYGGAYLEKLSNDRADFSLLNDGSGQVFLDHDDTRVVGVIAKGSARIDDDGIGRAVLGVFDKDTLKKVGVKLITDVSVGYTREEISRTTLNNGRLIITFSYRPYEISLLSPDVSPADPSVGVGRSRKLQASFTRMKKSSLDYIRESVLSQDERDTVWRAARDFDLAAAAKHCVSARCSVPLEGTKEYTIHRATQKTMPGEANGICVPFGSLTRDMTVNVFGQGGAVVPTEWQDPIYPLLNRTVFARCGGRIISGLKGDVFVPRFTDTPAPQWLPETNPVQQHDITTDGITIKPCRVSDSFIVSREAMLMTDRKIGSYLIEQFVRRLNLKGDAATLFGQGAADEPQGIFNTPGIGVTTFGGSATFTSLLAFEKNLGLFNADDNLAWAFSVNARNSLKKTPRVASTNFKMLWENDQVCDHPAIASNQLAQNDQCICADWSEAVLLVWGDGISITLDPYTYAKNAKIQVTVDMWCNLYVEHPEAFMVSTDSAAQ